MLIRLATFNVCHGTRGRGTPADHEALVAACRGLRADVLALQEVDRGTCTAGGVDQVDLLARALGLDAAFARARRSDGGEHGNALLVRGSVRDVEVLALRGRGLPLRRDRRSALLATAWVGDRALSVAVTHLSLRRWDSDGQEDRVLAALARRPEPRVLCGDLNRRPDWVAPGVLATGLDLVVAGGPTAPASNPRFRIDHVAVRGAGVRRTEVVDTGTSDHRALVVDLDLP